MSTQKFVGPAIPPNQNVSIWNPKQQPRFSFSSHKWSHHRSDSQRAHKSSSTRVWYDRNTLLGEVNSGRTAHYPSPIAYLKTPSEARKNWDLWVKEQQKQLNLTNEKSPVVARPPQTLHVGLAQHGTDKKGPYMRVDIKLDKVYPNFCFCFDYNFKDETEQTHERKTETHCSRARIATYENVWHILFECKQSHQYLIERMVGGSDEYHRLKTQRVGSESLKLQAATGQDDIGAILSVDPEYQLNKMWCEVTGFYEMSIYIPHATYRHHNDMLLTR